MGAAMKFSKGGRPKRTSNIGAPVSDPDVVTLARLGITKRESADWQWMATLPNDLMEAIFADAARSGRRVTTSELVRVAKSLAARRP